MNTLMVDIECGGNVRWGESFVHRDEGDEFLDVVDFPMVFVVNVDTTDKKTMTCLGRMLSSRAM